MGKLLYKPIRSILRAKMEHSYPKDLTEFILKQWHRPCSLPDWQEISDLERDNSSLPDPPKLERLLSICYQASLLRDEERPVRFRLILLEPDKLVAEHGPPKGLHRLVFTRPRPCNELELRRLSPSTDFYHSLIGVREDPEQGFLIWGVVHSGRRWVQTLYGGGKSFQPLPNSLVVHVTNPGRLSVCKGSIAVAALNAGQIICQSSDVFDSQWLKEGFASAREHMWGLHEAARERASRPWARLDPEFLRTIKKQVIMRVISRIRHSHHGGTIVCVPHSRASEFTFDNRYVDLKYKFMDEEPRKRFQSLLLYTANALAEAYGDSDKEVVGWNEYLASKNRLLSRLDEAIFEWAHLVAGLCAVDGAVFITTRFELLGFGGEISGKLDKVDTIARGIDPEGDLTVMGPPECVGTRHHSAYRLCNVLHDVMAMVVSQDGTVQIIKWKDGAFTYWNQVATSVMDI